MWRVPRGRVEVVPRAHAALLALDHRDALAREDEEALEVGLLVVEARRVARPQDVHADADPVRRLVGRPEAAPGPAALDGRPLHLGQVEDVPAAVGRHAPVLGVVDLRLVHGARGYPVGSVRSRLEPALGLPRGRALDVGGEVALEHVPVDVVAAARAGAVVRPAVAGPASAASAVLLALVLVLAESAARKAAEPEAPHPERRPPGEDERDGVDRRRGGRGGVEAEVDHGGHRRDDPEPDGRARRSAEERPPRDEAEPQPENAGEPHVQHPTTILLSDTPESRVRGVRMPAPALGGAPTAETPATCPAATAPRRDSAPMHRSLSHATTSRDADGGGNLVLRPGRPTDAAEIATLAQLDSARPLTGPSLVAENGGRLVAAVSLHDGRVVADPFAPDRRRRRDAAPAHRRGPFPPRPAPAAGSRA